MTFSLKFSVLMVIVVSFFAINSSNAQLPVNSFALTASFSQDWNDAGISYTLTKDFELGAGVTFKNISYTVPDGMEEPDSESTVGFYVYGCYYLYEGEYVSPYLGVEFDYLAEPTQKLEGMDLDVSELGVGFSFGAQAFITKGIALWTDIGVYYGINSSTYKPNNGEEREHSTNTLQLLTTSVGASFYF